MLRIFRANSVLNEIPEWYKKIRLQVLRPKTKASSRQSAPVDSKPNRNTPETLHREQGRIKYNGLGLVEGVRFLVDRFPCECR